MNTLKKDAAYVYGGFFLRYISLIILIPYYGRVLGPVSYGKVLAAMSLMTIVWMVVNFGFSITGARELAIARDEALHGHIFGSQFMGRLIMLPVGIIIGIAGTYFSPTLSQDPAFGFFATLLGVITAMNLGWFFQGLRRFRTSIFLEALAYPLNVIFVLLTVRTQYDGIYALVGLTASSAICTVLAYIVAFRTLKPVTIRYAEGFRQIRDAMTIFLLSVNAMLMSAGATYLLSIFSTSEQIGYFGSVEKLVSFAIAFLGPAAQILMPTIAHMTANDSQKVHGLVRKGILFELGFGICACIGGYIIAPLGVHIMLGTKFDAAIPLMRTLVWMLPFCALSHATGSYLLLPLKKEKWLIIAYVTGNSLNLLLICLLAHDMGGMGVCISRVASECVTATLLCLFSYKIAKTSRIKLLEVQP